MTLRLVAFLLVYLPTEAAIAFPFHGDSSCAPKFTAEKIRLAVSKIGIAPDTSLITAGQTMTVMTADGRPVCLRSDNNKSLEHIGIPLFSQDMRLLMPSPVYDFMEYALLDWKYKINTNPFMLEKVAFKKGNWETLLNGCLDSCECEISNNEEKYYVINWRRKNRDIVTVGIPIDYELLGNSNKRVAERDMIVQLENFKTPFYDSNGQTPALSAMPVDVNEEELKIYGTEGLFVKQGQWKDLPELNQNVYYLWQTIVEQTDTIIYGKRGLTTFETAVLVKARSSLFPAETFANLMLSAGQGMPDSQILLDFHLSDYRRQSMEIPVSQLTEFLRSKGMQIFFAPGIITKGKAKAMLFACNKEQGYNHLISLTTTTEELSMDIPRIKADVYLFIRPIDTEKLFKKPAGSKSKSGFTF